MKKLKDSSEILEAAGILDDLSVKAPGSRMNFSRPRPNRAQPSVQGASPARQPAPPRGAAAPSPAPPEGEFRGDRLESVLYAMCRRGGFIGALIADNDGLPLAVYNSPIQDEALGAFATILGAALEKAGRLLGQTEANNISVDINYTDKVVLRKFLIREATSFLLIICPQEVDERGEIELSIDQIITILQTQ